MAEGGRSQSRVDGIRVSHIAFPLRRPFRSGIHNIEHIFNVVVEFESDGRVGVGYSFAFRRADSDAVLALVLDLAAPLLGESPREVQTHWARMWARLNFIGHEGPPVMALAAIDTALWDLHARLVGLPLYSLLGTRAESWPAYASGGSLDLDVEALIAEALQAQRSGYSGYKCRVGSADLASDVDRIGAVRDAVGAGYPIMVDANQAWTRIAAARACRALAPFDLGWVEEPLDADDITGLADLRTAVDVPIAAGETAYGLRGIGLLLSADAVDVIQPDLMRCGGITPLLAAINLATAHKKSVMPHLYTETNAHLMGVVPKGGMIEHLPGWFDHLYGPPGIEQGALHPLNSPGLGVRLDREKLEPLTVSAIRLG